MEKSIIKKFLAEVDIMSHKTLLDPQGKVVTSIIPKLGIDGITNVRIGKHASLLINAENYEQATKYVEKACKEILVNHIMETYSFKITQLK